MLEVMRFWARSLGLIQFKNHLYYEKSLSIAQIAHEMNLDVRTVSKRLKQTRFEARKGVGRSSKLDAHKSQIKSWLEQHDYSAQQIFQMLHDEGFCGGYTIVREYVKKVRPRPPKAYLSLSFAPGECAQVDWGSFGSVPVGNTHRKLSFFVMVLSYSRMMYVEFTLSQKMEYFLQCHQLGAYIA
jgi:transposase